ncbi:MAG: hypothetical protein ACPHID_02285 [Thermoplasmatota archaeon]
MNKRDQASLATLLLCFVVLAFTPWERWTVYVWLAVIMAAAGITWFAKLLGNAFRDGTPPPKAAPDRRRAMLVGGFACATSCVMAAGLVQADSGSLPLLYGLLAITMAAGVGLVRYGYASER